MLNAQKSRQENGPAVEVNAAPKDEIAPTGPSSSEGDSGSSRSNAKNGAAPLPTNPGSTFTRDIVFADEVRRPPSLHEALRVPEQRSPDQHIAFLENQRNPKDKAPLRIPGPRDFDRGDQPESVNEEEDETGGPQPPALITEDDAKLNADDHEVKRNMTTDDSQHPPGVRKGLSAFKFPAFNLRSHGDGEPSPSNNPFSGLRNRARTNTFASARSQNSSNTIPYLSWEPTIGRNSAFVDLSEQQREELGGIEYRALKTLAWILCGRYCCHLDGPFAEKLLAFYLGFHVLGIVCFVPYILRHNKYGAIIDSDGLNRTWW
jgi:hypothetical protein